MPASFFPVVALTGNPNIGKSTLFNHLTGSNQRVGNWPGKTVSRSEGFCFYGQTCFKLVDLPGSYSLTALGPEETVTREFLLRTPPHVIVAVADATNLERNLYFILQILLFCPQTIVAVNFIDQAARQGLKVDTELLAAYLGVPVVPIAAAHGYGLDLLLATVAAVINGELKPHPRISFPADLNAALNDLSRLIQKLKINSPSPLWDAFCLLNGDDSEYLAHKQQWWPLTSRAAILRRELSQSAGEILATHLYNLASYISQQVIKPAAHAFNSSTGKRKYFARLARFSPDRIILHPLVSPLLFLAVFLCLLLITMFGAAPLTAALEQVFTFAISSCQRILTAVGTPPLLVDFLTAGILRGTAAVIAVMLPTMAIFYYLFALLEDSGLLPRLALVLDYPYRLAGSQGKQCICHLLGFGCNIPAITACRILPPAQRTAAIITAPLVPCNGRLGVILFLTPLFFAGRAPLVIAIIILAGLVGTFITTFIYHRVNPPRQLKCFYLELPPYRAPQWLALLKLTLKRQVSKVLWRAVAVAAPFAAVVWLAAHVPLPGSDYTLLNLMNNCLTIIGRVIGLDGQVLTALLCAWPARETVLGGLALTYGQPFDENESSLLASFLLNNWTLQEYAIFLVLFIFALPCLPTTQAIYRETGSIKTVLLAYLAGILYSLVLIVFIRLLAA